MSKRTREILALALIAVLGAVMLVVMGWYIIAGHRWNVAASNIDESVGKMDGYTVLLFEGTEIPQTIRDRISSGQPFLDDENRGALKASRADVESTGPVSLPDAAANYRLKGATVFVLRSTRPTDYDSSVVMNKNGMTIGVLHVDGAMSRYRAFKEADKLEERGVDLVVALLDDARLLEDPPKSVDIIICTSDEGLSSSGEYRSGAFCVDAPFTGQLQSVIVSPSNVFVSKTIESL